MLLGRVERESLHEFLREHEHRSLELDELVAAHVNVLLREGEQTQALDSNTLERD